MPPKLVMSNWPISGIANSSPDITIRPTALHDSGCAKTVIKESVFHELQKLGLIDIIQPIQPILLVTCTNEQQSKWVLPNFVTFYCKNNIQMCFHLNVIIHKEISQDFLLGRDFTGPMQRPLRPITHLYLTNCFDVYWDERRTKRINGHSM